MARISWLLLAAGCGADLVGPDDNLGPYFVISGELEPGLEVSGERTRAAIAWAFAVDGELGGIVQEVPFEPRLFAYALTVEVPPEPGDATDFAPLPPELDVAGLSFLMGLPVLYESPDDEAVPLRLDPARVVDWASGSPTSLVDAVVPESGGARVAATTPQHLLLGLAADSDVGRLAAAASWSPGGPYCRLDGLLAGLSLYRDEGLTCGGWRALAEAGERTEFQGVTMGFLPEE